MLVNPEHLNADSSIKETLLGMEMLVRLEQSWKAFPPMEVMLLGRVMLARLEQLWNVPKGISLRLPGRVTLVRLEQLVNVPHPKLVMLLFWKVTLSSLSH